MTVVYSDWSELDQRGADDMRNGCVFVRVREDEGEEERYREQ